MFDGRIEGDNLNPGMFGAGIILAPNPPNPPPPPPPQPTPTPNKRQRLYPLGDYPGRFQIKVPLADRDTMAFMQKKGGDFQREDLKPGIEFVVDATDATNGRVCVVGRSNTDKQIISLIPEDPATVANPSGKVYTNYGKAIFGSSAAFDWELHRNGSASMADDGTAVGTTRSLLRLGTLTADASHGAVKDFYGNVHVVAADDSDTTNLRSRSIYCTSLADGGDVGVLDSEGLRLPNGGQRVGFATGGDIAAVDVAISRSDAGKLILSDPAGGNTSPMLLFNGSAPTDAGLKRSSVRMQTRLGDDSAFAGHDVKMLDLYGASTAKRSRIDPGTPSADTVASLPNRTGSILLAPSTLTSGQLVQADANGDLVSAGSGGAVNYGGIKFSNGTIRRSINTGTGATTDELADLLYTIAYDLATTGLLADGAYLMTISPYTYEYDSAAYTFDELTCTIGTFVDLQQLSGFFKPYLFGVTTMHTQFVLDCDSYTLDQLCNVASALLTALGV